MDISVRTKVSFKGKLEDDLCKYRVLVFMKSKIFSEIDAGHFVF